MTLMTNRPAEAPHYFASWRAYLESWHEGGRTDVTLCRAITDIYQPLLEPEWQKLDEREEDVKLLEQSGASEEDVQQSYADLDEGRADVGLHYGFPWVTPVLGSGCLSAEEGREGAAIHSVPAEVARAASGWGELWDGTPKAEVVERFGHALVRGKVGEEPEASDQPVASKRTKALEAKRALTARVLLCAHLLSQLYFEVGALTHSPVGVSSGALTFDRGPDAPTGRGAELWDTLVNPLRVELAHLRDDITDSKRDDLGFVSAFTTAVEEDLARGRSQVTRSDAALMAEIGWHLMTEDTSQYPGWADLLVLLTLANQTPDRDQRWPHLTNLEVAREKLQVELNETTKLSWASRLPQPDTGDAAGRRSTRDRLYDAVAGLLVAQAALHANRPDGDSHERPPAVAYVTSFDLELEMALIARRSAFRLVMPFYVRDRYSTNPSGFVWLQTTITPPTADEPLTAKHLRDIRTTRGWTLVTSVPAGAEDDFTLPIVVRLAGCPLIRVDGFPDLGGRELAAKTPWVVDLKTSLGGRDMTLAGTVLLDEHTALHQWAADLGSVKNKHNQVVGLGLPVRLVKGGNSSDARFWFLLGVQLSDEAVRHRTAAIVGAADLRRGAGKPPRTSLRAGVVVNRRSTPNERDVFLWQRMDVVQATYEDVLPDLEHAAAHVTSPRSRRVQGAPCPLSSSPDETELP